MRTSSDIGWPFATRGRNELPQKLWRAREEEIAFGFDPSDGCIEAETTGALLKLVASDLHPELPAFGDSERGNRASVLLAVAAQESVLPQR